MPVLYVTEPRAVVRFRTGSIVVTRDSETKSDGCSPERRRMLAEVEPHRLELIALFGHVHITSHATRFCLRNGIGLTWFEANGRYLGRVVPEMNRSAGLRVAHYRTSQSPERALALACRFVEAKLLNAAALLRMARKNLQGAGGVTRAAQRLEAMANKARIVPDRPELFGLEGTGARTYFEALQACFKADIAFPGRARRPPPDPANALLSFGYTLLANAVAGLVEARGLDPALGFFHELRPGRPSLALDLLEELRHPVVDRFVVRSCNLRIFRPSMFAADKRRPGGVRLTREGLQVFFRHWERHLATSMREADAGATAAAADVMRRQVERLASALKDDVEYRPFKLAS